MQVGHPIFWLMLAAVAAPLLSRVPLGFKVPVVVFEVLLGILIGPHVLRLVELSGVLEAMFTFGMATTLFMAGMELDFTSMKGRPLGLALAAGVFRYWRDWVRSDFSTSCLAYRRQ